MKLIDRILSYPTRWRHTHGFGVHSPFAYHFITRVLREKKAEYYAYAEIAAFCPKARRAGFNEIFAGRDMSIPEAHMLFRVMCHFNPTHIVEVGHGHEVTNIIIKRSLPDARTILWHEEAKIPDSFERTPIVIVNQFSNGQTDAVNASIKGIIQSGEAVVIVRNLRAIKNNRKLWKKLLKTHRQFGMSFNDGYTGIFVGRRTLPSQHFNLIP